MKFFYKILEVEEWAKADEIRSAYLRLAREYHPDRVPEHLSKLRADAEAKFKEVQEAWGVLGDPAKRPKYDLQLRTAAPKNDSHPKPDTPPPGTPASSSTSAPPAFKGLREFLERHREIAKWLAITVCITAGLTIVGEFMIAHQDATRPTATEQVSGKPNIGGIRAGIRQYNPAPRHIQTWSAEPGKGLEVQLVKVDVKQDALEITFQFRAGDHSDLLLYEPPGAVAKPRRIMGREVAVDRDLEELYIEDSAGTKFYSTSGFSGGQQVAFNVYNFTRRINFRAREEVVLTAKFPPITPNATSITFVSPALGRWQPEWRWQAIDLK